ncbi:MAG TPA: PAS domain S-box protein [Terriglobia bacterium]|nr:PAS domain S-box protein [Terriglobia bacterium]
MRRHAGSGEILPIHDPCYSSCRLVCTDAIITASAEGVLNSFNQAAQDLFGYQPAEAIGKSLRLFLKGGEVEAERIRKQLLEGDSVHLFDTDIVRKDHKVVPIHLSASTLKDAFGSTAGFIAICHDLSPLRDLETAMAEKDQFFASILRNSADAILTMDPQERVTSWNKGAEDIFGYSEEEMLGKPLDVLLPEELKKERELEKISSIARNVGYLRSFHTQRVTKDGQLIDVIFTRTAIKNRQGDIVGYSSVLKDVTEQRLIERHLTHMEKLSAIGELSAGLAHEIKNPLAGIKGAIEIIREGVPEDNPHRVILGEVLSEGSRIDRIVMSLLSYAKPKKLDFVKIELGNLIRNVMSFLRNLADGKRISLRFVGPQEVPWLNADENEIKQLFLNLILNSIEALPEGGEVVVHLAVVPENRIRIEVSDNGPGIPPENLSRIFRPFFTTKTEGTGLGLATCKQIVAQYGGDIQVQSEEGKGTRFTIELPQNLMTPPTLSYH